MIPALSLLACAVPEVVEAPEPLVIPMGHSTVFVADAAVSDEPEQLEVVELAPGVYHVLARTEGTAGLAVTQDGRTLRYVVAVNEPARRYPLEATVPVGTMQEYWVPVGRGRALWVPDVQAAPVRAVANPGLVDIREREGGILLVGRALGSTDLVWCDGACRTQMKANLTVTEGKLGGVPEGWKRAKGPVREVVQGAELELEAPFPVEEAWAWSGRADVRAEVGAETVVVRGVRPGLVDVVLYGAQGEPELVPVRVLEPEPDEEAPTDP